MTYELAKQLKDAGFPQPKDALAKGSANLICQDNEYAYAPTLSELIEACGEQFYYLRYLKAGQDGTNWNHWTACDVENTKGMSAVSPEEAVAHLWLALNQK